ncbi:hypothetical protein VKT23_003139 [Stygiomarasmius scandens]|uniref:RING-type domain-containing protein n=1 Tax=Marasmiellus scandens TaxID=2682957 RepID=A0ABR1K200_9AGAR
MASYEDDFDRMEDDVDYGAIGEEEWVALNTQPSQILSTSTSHSSTRIPRDSSQQPESNVPERAATPYPDSRPLQPQEFIQGSSTSRTAITEPANTVRRRPSSSSSAYFSDDDADFDASFLEQLNHAEREAIGTLTSPAHVAQAISTLNNSPNLSTPSNPTRSRSPHHLHLDSPNHSKSDSLPAPEEAKSRVSFKRDRSYSPSEPDDDFPNKKGNRKSDSDSDTERLLDNLNDEMSCPVCFELMVGAQLINPCGHGLCGLCGYTWITLKKQTACPVCRTRCCHFKPLVPNIMVDNIIEKYIEILVKRGDKSWDVGGANRREWDERVDQWRKNVNFTRGPQKRVQSAQPADPDILFGTHVHVVQNSRSVFDFFHRPMNVG